MGTWTLLWRMKMTANELADLLIIVDALQGNVVLKESATMLRQQAEEIEQLKALAISLSHRNANLQYTRSEE